MQVGVLGSGNVGRSLATGFLSLGHQVKIGSRNPVKVSDWVAENGPNASAGTFVEAAAFGELIVFAVLGSAAEEVIRMADPANFAGKTVIDTTNALAPSAGGMPTLFVGHTDSLGERIQRALPQGRVVKAFNIVGYALMVHPQLPCGPPDMFICGYDADAKQGVTEILQAFGWSVIDIGPMEGARYLEPLAMVWILSAYPTQSWNQAFKLLRG